MNLCSQSVLTVTSLFLAASVSAFDTSRIEDPEVRACADRALPTKTASQVQEVEVVGQNGYVRESTREVFWLRTGDNDSRVLMRILEPPDERGVAVLVNDDADRNVVSYLTYSPMFKRVRRVSGESFFGTILGTDFTYEDFSYFYRVDEREEVKRVADSELDGFAAYVLETVKPDEESHYSMVRFFVDKALCLAMRTEFIALNGALRKELVADRDEVQLVDEHYVPFVTTMTDLKLGTKSIFRVAEVEIDPDLDAGMFESSALQSGGR